MLKWLFRNTYRELATLKESVEYNHTRRKKLVNACIRARKNLERYGSIKSQTVKISDLTAENTALKTELEMYKTFLGKLNIEGL